MSNDIFFKPPVHGRINNWLGPQMVKRLLDFAQAQRDNFRASVVWDGSNQAIDLNLRRSSRIDLFGELSDQLQTYTKAALPEMFRQLGTTPFKPSAFELDMIAHGDGAFFKEHFDRKRVQTRLGHRVISAVYYFHRSPKSFSGGALRIYPIAGSQKTKTFIEIEPVNDTLVFFPSWFPHEVLPVSCPSGRFEDSRFAINLWVHSAD
jgi:Rps23 Pro-64 3,4-dihydroxylase Tpa1-like proline 4-hydroxylase